MHACHMLQNAAAERQEKGTFVDVGDDVAQLVAGGGQRGGDAVRALVQPVPLRRIIVQQRPLLLRQPAAVYSDGRMLMRDISTGLECGPSRST